MTPNDLIPFGLIVCGAYGLLVPSEAQERAVREINLAGVRFGISRNQTLFLALALTGCTWLIIAHSSVPGWWNTVNQNRQERIETWLPAGVGERLLYWTLVIGGLGSAFGIVAARTIAGWLDAAIVFSTVILCAFVALGDLVSAAGSGVLLGVAVYLRKQDFLREQDKARCLELDRGNDDATAPLLVEPLLATLTAFGLVIVLSSSIRTVVASEAAPERFRSSNRALPRIASDEFRREESAESPLQDSWLVMLGAVFLGSGVVLQIKIKLGNSQTTEADHQDHLHR